MAATVGGSDGAPQCEHNLWPSSLSFPQLSQRGISRLPEGARAQALRSSDEWYHGLTGTATRARRQIDEATPLCYHTGATGRSSAW